MMFFFFNDTATTEIYTLSLHDALPISFKNTVLYSQLHIAAANGYYEVTTYLLTKRFDINETDNDGWTAAMAAACWGQIPVLELLAQNGADLDVKTKDNKALVGEFGAETSTVE